jgi:transmembrane sensor
MKHIDNHNNSESWEEKQVELFKNLTPSFKQEKAAVWDALFDKIEHSTSFPESKTVTSAKQKPLKIAIDWPKILIAASVVLIIGATLFCSLYTTSVDCSRGEHLAQTLPDGSKVQLNSESSISYSPYWWYFNRSITLKGEAFFEVKKGKKFTVKSTLGNTTVLGTSFNIFARNNTYKVLCTTGKVQVSTANKKNSVTLEPNQLAELKNQTILKRSSNVQANNIIAWKDNKFNFIATPLIEVFQEIERQYDVKLDIKGIPQHLHTGYFSKNKKVESTLNLICLTFNLKFKKTKNKNYKIEPL